MLTSHEDRMISHEEVACLIYPNLVQIHPTED